MAAGLGFKTFNTGDVLSAADTNGYLMQGVLVFASAAARDAAITSPQEGQCCYLKDTDAVQTYSGSAWVGFDDSNAIQNSIVDAKGDIVAASGNDTPARLAVGNNGEILVADSSATTGLRYQGLMAAGKNTIINGGFDIWQRGTSFAIAASTSYGSTTFSADRWQTQTAANQAVTISRQATGDTTNLPNIQYCARYQRNSGQTGTGALGLLNNFETVNSIPFVGKTITLSFYGRAGANYSAASSALAFTVASGTGTDQNGYAYTGYNAFLTSTATLTTTWQRFTATATVPTTATELSVQFSFTPVGTASTNDYFEVTGVQLELGSVATAFSRAQGTLQGELAACQRYYFRSTGGSIYSTYGVGYAYGATGFAAPVKLAVSMRVKPTSIDYSALAVGIYSVSVTALSAVTFDTTCSGFDWVMVVGTSSGLTQFRPYDLANNNNAAGYIGFNAEL